MSDPYRWDQTVGHYAAVGESITWPYCLDALATQEYFELIQRDPLLLRKLERLVARAIQ